MEENKDIKEAKEELNQLSRDEVLRRIALKEELRRMDIEQVKEDAEKHGREETKIKMVKNLYKINMPIEQIAEIAEIDIEKVKKIIDTI